MVGVGKLAARWVYRLRRVAGCSLRISIKNLSLESKVAVIGRVEPDRLVFDHEHHVSLSLSRV